MNCPYCNKRTRVFDTRLIEGGVNRKRMCGKHTFMTVERVTTQWLHKDIRKGRKKLPPKPKLTPPPRKPAPKPKTWLEKIQSEAGKLFGAHRP